jgi:hypothetical protein
MWMAGEFALKQASSRLDSRRLPVNSALERHEDQKTEDSGELLVSADLLAPRPTW